MKGLDDQGSQALASHINARNASPVHFINLSLRGEDVKSELSWHKARNLRVVSPCPRFHRTEYHRFERDRVSTQTFLLCSDTEPKVE
ncbi:hypothetical protein PM082_010752 [Marasmius tenuissimus]|nr:hypothetical protein PM082_010752 [Marasmius tenuissimus]